MSLNRMTAFMSRKFGEMQALRKFKHMEKKAGKRVLNKSIRAGGAVMLKETRRNTPVDKGTIKRGLRQKVKFYAKSGTMVSIIGAKKGRDAKSSGIASSIIHLAENDTKPHTIAAEDKRAMKLPGIVATAGGWSDFRSGFASQVRHPGTRGQKFIERSARKAKKAARQAFTTKMTAEVLAESKK